MKNQIKKFIRERHWTTKLVWGVGLTWILITVLAILIFPPGIAFKDYKIVSGEVVSKGVLNQSEGSAYPSNITCSKAEDCPFLGGIKACSKNKICLIGTTIQKPVEDSYGIQTLSGEVVGVIGGNLKKGEHVKLALEGNNVKENGGWVLWGSQVGTLRKLFLFEFLRLAVSESRGAEYTGEGVFIILAISLFYFFGVFILVQESLLIRFISGVFISWFVFPAIMVSIIYTNIISVFPFFVFLPLVFILIAIVIKTTSIMKKRRGVSK